MLWIEYVTSLKYCIKLSSGVKVYLYKMKSVKILVTVFTGSKNVRKNSAFSRNYYANLRQNIF